MARRNRKRSVGGDGLDPDPLTPEEIEEHYGGGDLTKSRLLTEPELLEVLRKRYGEMLPAMVDALVRVFPKDRCRAALESRGGTLVLCLFDIFPETWSVMAMAFDLATIGVEVVKRTDPKLLMRLSLDVEFRGAALEIGVWANAVRAGIRVLRVEAGAPKRPDLLLGVPVLLRYPPTADRPEPREVVAQVPVQVEIKGLAASDATRVPFQVSIWGSFFGQLPPEDRCASVRLRDGGKVAVRTATDRARIKAGADGLSSAIQRVMEGLERQGWPLGVHPLETSGLEGHPLELARQVVVEVLTVPTDGEPTVLFGGSLGADLFEDPDELHLARRPIARIDEAVDQLAERAEKIPTIVFLDVPMEVDLNHAFPMIEEALRTETERYRFLDGVLVRAKGRYLNGKEVWCCGALRGPAGRLDGRMLQALWDALTQSPHRLMGAWTDDDPDDSEAEPDTDPTSEKPVIPGDLR